MASLWVLNHRISRMVVDGFKVFTFHRELAHAAVVAQTGGDIAHHVYKKLRDYIRALGDVFFVWALEQAIQLARSLFFHQINQLIDLYLARVAQIDGDV